MKRLVVTLALLCSACGPQPDLQAQDPDSLPPFVKDYWINETDGERLETMMASFSSTDGYIDFRFTDAASGDEVRCYVFAQLQGTSKSGDIVLREPDVVYIEPSTAPPQRCEWLGKLTRYGVLGRSLVLSFDNSQSVKVFNWNPANY